MFQEEEEEEGSVKRRRLPSPPPDAAGERGEGEGGRLFILRHVHLYACGAADRPDLLADPEVALSLYLPDV